MKKSSVLLLLLVLTLFQNLLDRGISDDSPTSSPLLAPSASDDDGDHAPSPSDYDSDDAPSPSDDGGAELPYEPPSPSQSPPLKHSRHHHNHPSPKTHPHHHPRHHLTPDPEYQPPSPSQSPPLKHSHHHHNHPSPKTHPHHHPRHHLTPAVATAMKLQMCWKPIDNVKDCHAQIVSGFRTHSLDHIGSSCCKAINHITQDCFEVMFIPFHDRYFSFRLRDHCASMFN